MEQERIDRLDRLIETGNLLRKSWTDGNERACLLAALSPEAGSTQSASACPAEVMPRWLAELTPLMDDYGSLGSWSSMVRRYAAVARRWHVLDDAGWRRALAGSMAAVLDVALECAGESRAAVERVRALWLRVLAGDGPGRDEWAEAWAAAWAEAEAAWAAAEAAAAWAWAAAWAAEAAARAAAEAAWAAARAAARAAEWATAMATAWDRMSDGVLSAIETECAKAGG
jgi:hypothetical protein